MAIFVETIRGADQKLVIFHQKLLFFLSNHSKI